MLNVTDKAKKIKLLLLDVDGMLTNGLVYFADNGMQTRAFHIRDGMGIKLLHENNIETGLISAKQSQGVQTRATDLGMKYIYLGYEDKLPAYEKIKKESGYDDSQIAYAGDDLPDLAVLTRAGFALTVPEAPEIIQKHVDTVTQHKGGKGAVREICEMILSAQGLLEASIQKYLSR